MISVVNYKLRTPTSILPVQIFIPLLQTHTLSSLLDASGPQAPETQHVPNQHGDLLSEFSPHS